MGWLFDQDVAKKFNDIAQKHIPNYDMVIARCVELAKDLFKTKPAARILDVGSARGKTVARLIEAGFANTYGVEASTHMVAVSDHRDRITHSDKFPTALAPFDMVMANWTLHFVKEREEYMKAIFDGLSPGGMFILTDRMQGSLTSYNHYLDFKRSQGVTEAEITAKEASLKGVLEPRPLTWYLTTLQTIGFIEPEVIDAAWCFNTIMCRKPG